jgi:hypothetical protein
VREGAGKILEMVGQGRCLAKPSVPREDYDCYIQTDVIGGFSDNCFCRLLFVVSTVEWGAGQAPILGKAATLLSVRGRSQTILSLYLYGIPVLWNH